MELKGTIKKIGETQTFASGFQKREFIILTQEQFPQPINIELLGDKIDIVDPFKPDDEVVVGINIRGREWVSPQGETKYFNSITGWKITRPALEGSVPQQRQQETPSNNSHFEEEQDDLPF